MKRRNQSRGERPDATRSPAPLAERSRSVQDGVRLWRRANRRYLHAAVEAMYAQLKLYTALGTGKEDSLRRAFEAAADVAAEREQALPSPSALAHLVHIFGLKPFERDVLLLCAAVEFDTRFPALLEEAQPSTRPYPTFDLALSLLAGARWSALRPAGPLRYWKLLELGPGNALTASPLRLDERILHYLQGVPGLDERLPLKRRGPATREPLTPTNLSVARELAETWTVPDGARVAQVYGANGATREAVVRAAAHGLGLDCEVLPLTAVPSAQPELSSLLRLWNREVLLTGRVLLVECGESDEEHTRGLPTLLELTEGCLGAVAVSTTETRRLPGGSVLLFGVSTPSTDELAELWRFALGPSASDALVDRLAYQFQMGADAVRNAVAVSAAGDPTPEASADSPTGGEQRLWQFCRQQARLRMEGLADRIDSRAGWSDLILPTAQRSVLAEIEAQVRHRGTVYSRWGFSSSGGRGLGISVLFAGTSGTGKTLAAEVLANELQVDLYRIDLSAVVSKFIGETEKNLRKLFDAAEEGGAALLFDEADALFGKRSEVKDSHDRHANIEVSYLLQRMEQYRGLAILTSNLKSALDVAFLRRLRFVVDFPFPGPAERKAIWQRAIPASAPTQALDFDKLARLSMAGGNLRNIALSGAFLAANDGGPLTMGHLLRAARSESLKQEKPLSEAEVRDWV